MSVGNLHQGKTVEKEWIFSGGMNRSLAPHQIQDTESWLLQNCYYPRETPLPKTRPGTVRLDAGTGKALDKITALIEYHGGGDGTATWIVATALHTVTAVQYQGLFYLDANEEWQQIAQSLGSLSKPCLAVFAGYLIVAVPGQTLKLWNGYTGGSPVRATGEIVVGTTDGGTDGLPTAGETMTIDDRAFTFVAARSQPGEITIGATNAATAANIVAAIATDCARVSSAVQGSPNTRKVTVTARETGAAPNSYVFSETVADADFTMTGGGLFGDASDAGVDGANGCQLDTIDSYLAPKPGIVVADKNGRLVAAGDTSGGLLDVLYWSHPRNPWKWAGGDYDDAEAAYVGYREGNQVTAVVPHLGEIFVHKTGQNREIHRIEISNPDPEAWSSQRRFFSGCTAAINQDSAVSVADKQVILDGKFMRSFQGNDAYDELRSGIEANKMVEFFSPVIASESFIVVNPEELYLMLFLSSTSTCLVYHYGSGRWTIWTLTSLGDITCGIYSESLGTVVLGTDNGRLYKFDSTYASDNGVAFSTTMIGKAVTAGFSGLLLEETVLDWLNHLDGSGSIMMCADVTPAIASSKTKTLVDGGIVIAGVDLWYVADASTDVYAADTPIDESASGYGTYYTTQGFRGGFVSPIITFTGAATISSMKCRFSLVGKRPEAGD